MHRASPLLKLMHPYVINERLRSTADRNCVMRNILDYGKTMLNVLYKAIPNKLFGMWVRIVADY